MAITPAPTPRQVIPFGDRPIIDGRGHPTFEMYQWMQRVGQGVTTSITNIDTTVTEVNTVVVDLNTVETTVEGVQTDISGINTSIGELFGWIQILLNAAAGSASASCASGAQSVRWRWRVPAVARRRNGQGLVTSSSWRRGGNPTKISAMSDLDLNNVTGDERLAGETGASANIGALLDTLYTLFAAYTDFGFILNPLNGTAGNPAGFEILFQSGAAFAGSNNAGNQISLRGGAGDGPGVGGNAVLSAGAPGATGDGGALSLSSGNGGATSGNGGSDQCYRWLWARVRRRG
jgi:hypothetical protein